LIVDPYFSLSVHLAIVVPALRGLCLFPIPSSPSLLAWDLDIWMAKCVSAYRPYRQRLISSSGRPSVEIFSTLLPCVFF